MELTSKAWMEIRRQLDAGASVNVGSGEDPSGLAPGPSLTGHRRGESGEVCVMCDVTSLAWPLCNTSPLPQVTTQTGSFVRTRRLSLSLSSVLTFHFSFATQVLSGLSLGSTL